MVSCFFQDAECDCTCSLIFSRNFSQYFQYCPPSPIDFDEILFQKPREKNFKASKVNILEALEIQSFGVCLQKPFNDKLTAIF